MKIPKLLIVELILTYTTKIGIEWKKRVDNIYLWAMDQSPKNIQNIQFVCRDVTLDKRNKKHTKITNNHDVKHS